MNINDYFSDDKTIYTITDEHGEKGNAVRERARLEAEKCPGFVPLADLL